MDQASIGVTSPHSSSHALADLFEQAGQRMSPTQATAPPDGFLFSGNRHESVPRALFLDRRLTPLERNAWQIIRLQLNQDGLTVFPSYEQLRPFLSTMPCGPKASHETIARTLTILRLTRWLSLVRRQRNVKNGRIQGNLYVLHDEPLTPWEAMQLDPEYLGLVSHALSHVSKAIQRVGCHVLQEVVQDPMIQGRTLPNRLQLMAERMAVQDTFRQTTRSDDEAESYPQESSIHESEEGENHLLRNGACPSSDSEVGPKAPENGVLRNPKQDSTVRSSCINKVRTTEPCASDQTNLRLPERFRRLKNEQQQGALAALHSVHQDLQQAVLDEWATRCQNGAIRNPAGYLFGIIRKALRGEFNAGAIPAQSIPVPPLSTASEPPQSPPVRPEVAQQYIAHLKNMLRLR